MRLASENTWPRLTFLYRCDRPERNASELINLFQRVVERNDIERFLRLHVRSFLVVLARTKSNTFSSSFGLSLIFRSSGERKVHPATLCSPSLRTRAALVSTVTLALSTRKLTSCSADSRLLDQC